MVLKKNPLWLFKTYIMKDWYKYKKFSSCQFYFIDRKSQNLMPMVVLTVFKFLKSFFFKVQMQTQLHLTQGSVILSRNLTIDTIHCNPDLMKSARNTGLNFRYQQDSKTRRLGKKAQVWQCVYIKSFFSIIQIKCFKIRSSSLSAWVIPYLFTNTPPATWEVGPWFGGGLASAALWVSTSLEMLTEISSFRGNLCLFELWIGLRSTIAVFSESGPLLCPSISFIPP